MTFALRFAIIALTAFSVANVVGCALVPWLWRRRVAEPSVTRADHLRGVRLLPVVLALGATAWASLSFAVFEPRDEGETMGVVLMLLAAAGGAMILGSLARLGAQVVRSRRLLSVWTTDAVPMPMAGATIPAFVVSSAFPIVAVIGILRPRLVVARSVLDACTPEQLRVVLAHEQGHVIRRDNAYRLLLSVTPDLLSWLPMASRLLDEWNQAAEDAADDCAGADGPAGRLLLAEALIRVARLTPASDALVALPASALYRGESIERRVRRLLAPPAYQARAAASRTRRIVTLGAMLTASVLTLHVIHEIVEAAVAFLP